MRHYYRSYGEGAHTSIACCMNERGLATALQQQPQWRVEGLSTLKPSHPARAQHGSYGRASETAEQ
jgi:hypothetical protein